MTSFGQNSFKKYKEVIVIPLYFLACGGLLAIVNLFFKDNLFEASNFLFWDAEHYQYIMELGYKDYRVAFFPLFPLLWRWLSLSVYGAVVFNAIIFILSFWYLSREFRFSIKHIILYLSIPGFVFYFLPYTESLFFASAVLIIIGIRREKLWLTLIGLFISSLSRPAFTILLPAMIIAEIWLMHNDKSSFKTMTIRLILYILVLVAGTLLVAYIQYIDTNEWFTFFEAQKGWGNHLQFPKYPFVSWAGGYIVRLDAAAFIIGTASALLLAAWLLRINPFRNYTMPKELIISLAYLGGITLSVILFRGGNLFSLNRFVFSTAFIVVAFHYFLTINVSFNIKQIILVYALILTVLTVLFGAYVHIVFFLNFTLLSLYLTLPVILRSDKLVLQNIGYITIVVLNIYFQISFYIRFLSGGWIA